MRKSDNAASECNRTERTTVRQAGSRAVYHRAAIYGIIDEALICHIGFVDEGQPYVIPANHARSEDRLFIHGSPTSRMLKVLSTGAPACITFTLVDGLVLARAAARHSMNYRSVVLLAQGQEVSGREAKRDALRAITEHVAPGRWQNVRPPNDTELDACLVMSFPISEASAKVRMGPPNDRPADRALRIWAGVVPLALTAGELVGDPHVPPGITPYAMPARCRQVVRRGSESEPWPTH